MRLLYAVLGGQGHYPRPPLDSYGEHVFAFSLDGLGGW
jgi:hypothetical protein